MLLLGRYATFINKLSIKWSTCSSIACQKCKFWTKTSIFSVKSPIKQIVKLKNVAPDNKIPVGLLEKGGKAINDGILLF